MPLIEEVGAKYGEHYCSHTEVMADESEDEASEHEYYLLALLLDIYRGSGTVTAISPEMVAITARKMIQSYEQGYGVDFSKMDLSHPDNAFHKSILDNIFAFSAAKQYQVFVGIAALKSLHDTFASFRDEALRVNKLFNYTYANLENGHAAFSGQIANFWHGIDDEDTILEYVTKGDHRVRDNHKMLHGIRRRKSDPFWLSFMPPWEYGCRCWVVDTGSTNGQKLNMDREIPDVSVIPKEFRFNVGAEGIIWNREHNYFSLGNGGDAAMIHQAISQAKTRLGY
jgi:SPP1 gp7 family putative phage head morphogenesis protein